MRDIIFNRRHQSQLYTDSLVVFDEELIDRLTVSVASESTETGDIREAAILLSEKNVKALHSALGNWLKNKRLEHAMRDGGGL